MTSIFGLWTWWSTLILLLLRFTSGEEEGEQVNITSVTDEAPTTTTPSGPASADRLGELAVLGIAYPSDAVYKGTDVTLYCCVNMDPQGLIDVAGVLFVQNTTVVREPTNHPFHHVG
ncbi:hypothetical protein TELCIR_14763 [Teladorsagia circumcincta]|uniref:Uncharacterized protein n=1 Tax=Teladorsagia circumcincta TaxID=45464 RepID=A0A2G9U1Q1_TELCI|nr:hypothetical protein TELCIR_14763 [Teladorsagia circumcincta]